MSHTKIVRPNRTHMLDQQIAKLALNSNVRAIISNPKTNASQTCNIHQHDLTQLDQKRKWREDHTDFIIAYNATIKAEGLPLDEWRNF